MPDLSGWLILVGGALVGSIVAGVAGFGAGVILLPLVAWTVGVRATVPVLTVTMLLGNLSRAWWSRGEIDRAVVLRFLVGAVPATALGTMLYMGVTGESLSRIIGAFFIAAVPLRRALEAGRVRMGLPHFAPLGAAFGLLSSLVVTTGPLMSPFFLAYGLRRGGYVATDALCTVTMHVTRGAALAGYALLTWETIGLGLALGATMVVGSWVASRLLGRMSDRIFLRIVEALLVVMGLQFLVFPR